MTMMLVDRYTLAPGCCLSCYSANLPAVSTGIDVHQPGQLTDAEVVLCHRCVLHMARLAGAATGYAVITQAELDETAATIVELHQRIIELNDQRDRAYHARNAVLASVASNFAYDEPVTTLDGVVLTIAEPTPVDQGPAVIIKAHMTATVSEGEPEPEAEVVPLRREVPPAKKSRHPSAQR